MTEQEEADAKMNTDERDNFIDFDSLIIKWNWKIENSDVLSTQLVKWRFKKEGKDKMLHKM